MEARGMCSPYHSQEVTEHEQCAGNVVLQRRGYRAASLPGRHMTAITSPYLHFPSPSRYPAGRLGCPSGWKLDLGGI